MQDITTTSMMTENINSQEPLLPRSPWNSQLTYLRILFRVKKALDRIEKEAGIINK
jgi:hypothetical protein